MKACCKHLFTMIVFCTIIISTPISAYADVGGICAEGVDQYAHNYSLTGIGADDIVAIALAQKGRTGESLGYHTTWGGWCAAFVNDCAYLAGQSEAIPFQTGNTHDATVLRRFILNSGGTEVSSPQKGDIVFYYNGSRYSHVGIMTDASHTIEGNVSNMVKEVTPYGRGYSSISFVRPNYKNNNQFYLDVNGILNGVNTGTLQDYGTCDVYINGKLERDDTDDYYASWPAGTSYEIKDIRPKEQHTYSGNSSYSGTIGTSTVNINLPFDTYGTLTVRGRLDDTVSSDLSGYGTFDVYINGIPDESGVTSYSKKWPRGTAYEVRNPNALEDHLYEGPAAGNQEGTLGFSECTVILSFITKGVPCADWTYTNRLPGNITSDSCDIEYQYTEARIATSSPGSDWIRQEGSEKILYENDGDVYDSDFELSTSDTRVYVGSYYYHYCGTSTGTNVEHYNDGTHTDYHVAGDVNSFYVSGGPYTDDNDSRYLAYQIRWVSGQWADGLATCAQGRSAIWYRRYQYQNKKAVTYYTWTKTSDWLTEANESGMPSQYRYRLRDTGVPVISTVKVTEISPTGYTITCNASDDSGIVKLSALSWTDTELQSNARINEAVPTVANSEVEISITIPVSEHNNEKDVKYNTKITIYDKAGNTAEYTDYIEVFIPMLVRSPKKLNLPENLKEIEDEAFAGSAAFGEVYIPDGTEKIGSRAFASCSRLVFISIPDSVTEISDNAFDGSGNVVILCCIDSEAEAFAKRNHLPYFTVCIK